MTNNSEHKTVFRKEATELLALKANGSYVDATLGGSGHSKEILKVLDETGTLISIDQDKEAIENFTKVSNRLDFKGNLHIVHGNFRNIAEITSSLKVSYLDGILADLGWASTQLQTIPGLSHEQEQNILDMRFSKNLGVTASDLLNALGRNELKKMFSRYADIFGKKLNEFVDEIIRVRRIQKILTVGDFNTVIVKGLHSSSISERSKVYQALRIAVNDEYNALNDLLEEGFKLLHIGGVFVAITFHSGEEKLIEAFIEKRQASFEILTRIKNKDYWQPDLEELQSNIRARSAKLWAIRKIKTKV